MNGSWELCQYLHWNGETESDGDDSEIRSWLCGSDDISIDDFNESTGLQLNLRDGAFSERGADFCQLMFDTEGIQVNDYRPMSGRVLFDGRVGSLIPDGVPEYSLPYPVGIALRYGDGDTKVCDTIRLINDSLVRQLSVVTDELYLDRIVLVYGRVDAVA
ncbi:hypothetical protein FYK55_26200 [Roseiconus nitratireducens]|uniref:Uncharacterized protein n=2 Tax=Roseiconus nitratireducens TaxID=2605748 RepID=A0A5M6CUR0_9BACT|nr:hypothetical protein FYK55_26200 [Roseiconus nitratireducens]